MNFLFNFPFFTIILSLLTAVLCVFFPGRIAKKILVTSFAVNLLLSLIALWSVKKAGTAVTYLMGHFPAPWGNEIRFGPLETLMAAVFEGVLLLSVAGGWRYIERDVAEGKQNLYCILCSLLGAAMLAMTYTNDLFTGYVFLEILTLTACGILIVRGVGKTTLAAVRYMIFNLVGSGLFLLGVILLYGFSGNLLMESIHDSLTKLLSAGADRFPLLAAVTLICIGLGIKSGLFPFHFWMPDTYGYATPASGSILSGVVSKGYILLLIKVLLRVIGQHQAEVSAARHILLLLGMGGVIFGSVSAILQKRSDRMIAYSSAAQIGYIYLGIGLGSTVGITAALYHILAHALTKPALFLSNAVLAEDAGGCDFKQLRGSGFRRPLAGAVFTAASLSMIGIPFFSGFFSKLLIGMAALSHQPAVSIPVLLTLAVSTVLNVVYYLHTVLTIYTPPLPEEKEAVTVKEGRRPLSRGFAFAGICFTLLSLLLGIFSGSILTLLERGAALF